MEEQEEEVLKFTTFEVVRAIFRDIGLITFLLIINITFTKMALGIRGDDPYTRADERLEPNYSPFLHYEPLLNNITESLQAPLVISFLLWLVFASLYNVFESMMKKRNIENTILGFIVTKLFWIRQALALFTLVYFIISLLIFFFYTSNFKQ
jgi:hypothetical protein